MEAGRWQRGWKANHGEGRHWLLGLPAWSLLAVLIVGGLVFSLWRRIDPWPTVLVLQDSDAAQPTALTSPTVPADLSPDGRWLAVGWNSYGNRLEIWDLHALQRAATVELGADLPGADQGNIWEVRVSADGQYVVARVDDQWRMLDRQGRAAGRAAEDRFLRLALAETSPVAPLLALSDGNTTQVLDIESGVEVGRWTEEHSWGVRSRLEWSGDGRYLLLKDSTRVLVYEVSGGATAARFEKRSSAAPCGQRQELPSWRDLWSATVHEIRDARLSADGRMFALLYRQRAGHDGAGELPSLLLVGETATGSTVWEQVLEQPGMGMAFSADGSQLYVSFDVLRDGERAQTCCYRVSDGSLVGWGSGTGEPLTPLRDGWVAAGRMLIEACGEGQRPVFLSSSGEGRSEVLASVDGQVLVQVDGESVRVRRLRRWPTAAGAWAFVETWLLWPASWAAVGGLVLMAGRSRSWQFMRPLPRPLWAALGLLAAALGLYLAEGLLTLVTEPLYRSASVNVDRAVLQGVMWVGAMLLAVGLGRLDRGVRDLCLVVCVVAMFWALGDVLRIGGLRREAAMWHGWELTVPVTVQLVWLALRLAWPVAVGVLLLRAPSREAIEWPRQWPQLLSERSKLVNELRGWWYW